MTKGSPSSSSSASGTPHTSGRLSFSMAKAPLANCTSSAVSSGLTSGGAGKAPAEKSFGSDEGRY